MCAPVQPKHILECSTFRSDRSLVYIYVARFLPLVNACMCAWIFIFSLHFLFFVVDFLHCGLFFNKPKKVRFLAICFEPQHRTFLLQSGGRLVGWLLGRSQFVFTFYNIAFFMTFYGSSHCHWEFCICKSQLKQNTRHSNTFIYIYVCIYTFAISTTKNGK